MMRELDDEEITAISQRSVVARDLVWVTASDRTTGEKVSQGFSNFVRNLDIQVMDGRTGLQVTRTFYGVGGAMSIGSIPLTSDITVRNVDITLPDIDSIVELMVRGYDVRNAQVQIYRVLLDPDTRLQVAPAKARFVGYVDGSPIVTPQKDTQGTVTFNCVSTTRELTRASPDVCSHESQLARTSGADDFYIDMAVVGSWQLFWGQASGVVTT